MSLSLRRFSTFAFAILICASAWAADLESGKRAYDQKDYATAFKEFAPLADQGQAEAQLYLGKMYMMGQGVLKDTDKAIRWFKASAYKGNADAQFFLGSIYLLPKKDIAEGLKWLRLAAKHNLEFYGNELLAAEGQMSAAEIAKGKALAEAWKPKHDLRLDEKPHIGGKSGS